MSFFNPYSHAFGLDIGDRSFKAVQFSRHNRTGDHFRMTAFGDIAVPEGIMENGNIMDMDKAAATLRELLKKTKGKLRSKGVVACLPETKTFIKLIELSPAEKQKDMRKNVLTEIEQNIPLPATEIYYDWQAVDGEPARTPPKPEAPTLPAAASEPPSGTEQPPRPQEGADSPAAPPVPEPPMRILIGAAPKTLVDQYTEVLERASLAPLALEIEAAAICRAVLDESEMGEPIGILDIGATRSSLVVFDKGTIQMSISIPISGIEITRLIGEALGIKTEDAEILKLECGLDATRCEDRMWKIMLPLIDDMTEKIRDALRFYKIGFPEGNKIEKVLLCGGGALYREIDTVLSRKLTIKVRRADPLLRLRGRPRGLHESSPLLYATAIGLAMRAADESRAYKTGFPF